LRIFIFAFHIISKKIFPEKKYRLTVKFIVYCQKGHQSVSSIEKYFLMMIYPKKNTCFSLPEEENTPK